MTRQRAALGTAVFAVLAAAQAVLPAPATAATVTTTASQTSPIYVGDEDAEFQKTETVTFPANGGQADVWPSVQQVPHLARIVDLNVTVGGITHVNPDDIELVLVEQGGPQVTLMANAGGATDANGVDIIFDDEAGSAVPDDTALSSGKFQPAAYGTVSQLPSPAPAVTGNTALSVFDGTPAGSTWQLFAYDDDDNAVGGTFDFWRLELTYATAPYPSPLQVSGVGTVQDVNVTLHGFTSGFPQDVDLLLEGPGGQQATLMSDVGGMDDTNGITLTFDDEAAGPVPVLPPTDVLQSGTYRPTNGPPNGSDGADTYPDPAPPPTGDSSLAAFDGTDPNGTWRLFAVDDTGLEITSIDGGWSLAFEWDDSAAPTGTVSIAGGAATTATTAVTLSLSASDPSPGSGVTQMRFSNDGTTYSAFQPYAATAPWALSPGDGTKTVYAQFRDAAGNLSPAVSDTIQLAVPAPPPADTTSPTAKKVKPKAGSTGVRPTAKVKVVATEALDPKTVTKKSVVLKRNGIKVKAKVLYKAQGHAIVLVPNKPMKRGKYNVTVSTSVTDLAGNRFDGKPKAGVQALRWKFRV